MKIKSILAALFLAALTFCSAPAFAEGSVDLIKNKPDDGYRPYLEWSSQENINRKRRSVIYAYAEAGETIYFGTSAHACNADTIKAIWSDTGSCDVPGIDRLYDSSTDKNGYGVGVAVTLPNGSDGMPYDPDGKTPSYALVKDAETSGITDSDVNVVDGIDASSNRNGVYLFRTKRGSFPGCIRYRSWETAGPKDLLPSTADTNAPCYTPLSFTAPVTGTYSFRFLSEEYTINSGNDRNPRPVIINKGYDSGNIAWNQDICCVAAFDVTVAGTVDGVKTARRGRVWSDMLFLNSGANVDSVNNYDNVGKRDVRIYSKVYILTHGGFEYEVDLNGLNPWGFVLYSNNRGFLWDPDNKYVSTAENPDVSGLQPLMHSYVSYSGSNTGTAPVINGGAVYTNHTPTDPIVDKSHKIFFNDVFDESGANGTNDSMIKAYTTRGHLTTKSDIENDKKSAIFTVSFAAGTPAPADAPPASSESAETPSPSPTSTPSPVGNIVLGSCKEGEGGTFTVTVDKSTSADAVFSDQSVVRLNFSEYRLNAAGKPVLNSDGSWKKRGEGESATDKENSNFVILTNTSEAQGNSRSYTAKWDGRDAYNNVVPCGTYEGIAKTYLGYGVMHLPIIDAEQNPDGIKIKMMNFNDSDFDSSLSTASTGRDRWTVFYNNDKAAVYMNYASFPYYCGSSTISKTADWYRYTNIGDNKVCIAGTSSQNGAMSYTTGYGGVQAGDATALDMWTDYLYAANEFAYSINVTKESEILYPYLSFIAENGVAADELSSAGGVLAKSHVKHMGNFLRSFDGKDGMGNPIAAESAGAVKRYTGESGYGNSISTGFAGTLTNQSENDESYTDVYWHITMPAGNSNMFLKRSGSPTVSAEGSNTVDTSMVVADSAGTVRDPGTIYRITGYDDGKINLRRVVIKDSLGGTTVSGKGSLLCGIVLDNLYMIDSRAILSTTQLETDEWKDIIPSDISRIETYRTQNASYGDYQSSGYNESLPTESPTQTP